MNLLPLSAVDSGYYLGNVVALVLTTTPERPATISRLESVRGLTYQLQRGVCPSDLPRSMHVMARPGLVGRVLG